MWQPSPIPPIPICMRRTIKFSASLRILACFYENLVAGGNHWGRVFAARLMIRLKPDPIITCYLTCYCITTTLITYYCITITIANCYCITTIIIACYCITAIVTYIYIYIHFDLLLYNNWSYQLLLYNNYYCQLIASGQKAEQKTARAPIWHQPQIHTVDFSNSDIIYIWYWFISHIKIYLELKYISHWNISEIEIYLTLKYIWHWNISDIEIYLTLTYIWHWNISHPSQK